MPETLIGIRHVAADDVGGSTAMIAAISTGGVRTNTITFG